MLIRKRLLFLSVRLLLLLLLITVLLTQRLLLANFDAEDQRELLAAGNALAFALEALVAGVQALRLEFYELFSRLFEAQGRPFSPWHLPVQRTEVML